MELSGTRNPGYLICGEREKRSCWITGALGIFHIELISQAGMGFPAFLLQELCINQIQSGERKSE